MLELFALLPMIMFFAPTLIVVVLIITVIVKAVKSYTKNIELGEDQVGDYKLNYQPNKNNLIKCDYCGTEYKNEHAKCPSCGAGNNKLKK